MFALVVPRTRTGQVLVRLLAGFSCAAPAAAAPSASASSASASSAAVPALSATAPMRAVEADRRALPVAGPRALPRQFTVEVATGGALYADGAAIGNVSELERWARRASTSSRFAGAAVFGDLQRDAEAVHQALDILRRAGFVTVRSAGRVVPTELSAGRLPGNPPVVSLAPATSGPAVSAPRMSAPRMSAPKSQATLGAAPVSADVSVATVGLHVDGALNREPHRGRLVQVFERKFGAFKRCHQRASPHAQNASFGVDLWVPKAGGFAKVRQTRTRLGGDGFRACMHAVFETIRFDPPPSERPEIVSYSLLFKPPPP
jgi:hypothetical protein